MHAPWRIEMLGELRAVQGDRVLTRFRTQQAGLLLAYLAYQLHRPHPRDVLIELLWPECHPAAGRNSLRVALSSLRRQLEPPGISPGTVLVSEGAAVRLHPIACVTDVGQFDASLEAAAQARDAVHRAQWLADAVQLYRDELLVGYLEPWVLLERQRRAQAYLEALGQLAALVEQSGDLPQALQWTLRRVTADPLLEEAQYELIRLLAAAGDPGAALRQYEEFGRRLAGDLGDAPGARMHVLVEAIRRGAILPRGAGARRDRSRLQADALSVELAPARAEPSGIHAQSHGLSGCTIALSPCQAGSPPIPSGTVSFLLIEVTGGPVSDDVAVSESNSRRISGRFVLDQPFALSAGAVVQETSRSMVLAFVEARHALATASAAERAVHDSGLRARMALHTGDVEAGEALQSPALRRGMRLLLASSEGQILVSAVTAALLRDELGPGQSLIDRGPYRLRDQDPPERLYELVGARCLPSRL